jgi:hypothetical protein
MYARYTIPIIHRSAPKKSDQIKRIDGCAFKVGSAIQILQRISSKPFAKLGRHVRSRCKHVCQDESNFNKKYLARHCWSLF